MGMVIPFPPRLRHEVAKPQSPAPLWALPGMMAMAWSEAYSRTMLGALPSARSQPASSGEHVVLPWRGPRKQA